MSYKAILAEHLVEKHPAKARELQKAGKFMEYVSLAEKNVLRRQKELREQLGGDEMARVQAREIALAEEMEPSLEELGIPNEFEMMRKDGFPL